MRGPQIPMRRVEIGNPDQTVKVAAGGLSSLRVSLDGEARANGTGGYEKYCQKCGRKLHEDRYGKLEDSFGSTGCTKNPEGDGGHMPADVPLAWANSVGVELNDREDEIKLHVSVGDPRGALVMTVRKVDGKLWLHVPHEGEDHVTLLGCGDGTFLIA